MSDLLVIKSGINVKADLMDHWRKEILKMKETGVVVLPWYLEAIVVPEDVAIKIGENSGYILRKEEIHQCLQELDQS